MWLVANSLYPAALYQGVKIELDLADRYTTPMLDAATRLRNAIISGNLSITKRLLSRFPELWLNIDSSNDGWCNLHYAAYHGHYLICFHLISMMNKYKREIPGIGHICDIDLVTFNNLTVFHMPLEQHYSQTLHYLLQAFASSKWLDQKGGQHARAPIHCCCASDFIEGLNLFLEFGADWSAQDVNGDTCLHICFANGSFLCVQGLVKGIATRIATLQLRKSDDNESSIDKGEPTVEDIVQKVSEELIRLEATLNHRGFLAFDQALTDAIVTQYKTLKLQWVTACVESEMTLREPAPSILSNVNPAGGTIGSRPRLLSVSSSVTSSFANIGKAMSRSSLDSDISSAINPSQIDVSILAREANSSVKAFENNLAARKHLSSLPNATQQETIVAQVAFDKVPQMRQHSKSFGNGYRTSPGQLRTPKISLSQTMAPPSPLPFDFAKNPSLKSIMISPLSRHNKRNDVEDLTEESELEESVDLSDSSISSNLSWAVATPNSSKLLSQLYFSPISALRRRSISATNTTVESTRSVGEDGPVVKIAGNKLTNFPFFRRNFSTPTFSLEANSGSDSHSPQKSSRRPSINETCNKPNLRLVIPENASSSILRAKTSAFSPMGGSVASDDGFESSPSTLTPYKIKPIMLRDFTSRVDSILETSEVYPPSQFGESVNSISFTRVRGGIPSGKELPS